MKTIKFNLNINSQMIRSVDELIKSFNIDEIYELYELKILQKWLRVHHESELADQLDHIDEQSDLAEKILRILKIFNFNASDSELQIYAHLYKRAYKERVSLHYQQEDMFKKNIIQYHQNYIFLKMRLRQFDNMDFVKANSELTQYTNQTNRSSITNKKSPGLLFNSAHTAALNTALTAAAEVLKSATAILNSNEATRELNFIKATVNEIANTSLELFELDVVTFFNEFIESKPIIVMCCLMNPELKDILWSQQVIKDKLSQLATDKKMIESLKPYLNKYQGSTEGMWKYLGAKDESYLIIHMGGGCRVGEQHALDVDYGYTEIDGKYKILKGLLFKSTSISQYVYYIEV